MCGYIAQLVEHRTGIVEVMGSNPVEALIFSGFFFPIAYIGKLTAMSILHFKLNSPCFKVLKKMVTQQWNHLSDVDQPELDGGDVMILIGADVAHLLIHLEVCQGRWNEPIAVKTPLGWPLSLQGNQCKLSRIKQRDHIATSNLTILGD